MQSLLEAVEWNNENIVSIIKHLEEGSIVTFSTTRLGQFIAAKEDNDIYILGEYSGIGINSVPKYTEYKFVIELYKVAPFLNSRPNLFGGTLEQLR
ncbi:hypothetical protein ACQKNS_24450 [Peribacillus sp. NPDC094092]|uniref:hypothetical protein n=1 Tax=Peribacillus sp. NPDC094092 TaxID=3390611 RepID=UPI003D00C8C3